MIRGDGGGGGVEGCKEGDGDGVGGDGGVGDAGEVGLGEANTSIINFWKAAAILLTEFALFDLMIAE